MKKSIDQVDVEGRFVLMRADFNVPLDDKSNITDDRRIVEALPTIRHILEHDGRLILMSHLGRPQGEPVAKYSLAPVARRLGELLGQDVPLVRDYITAERAEPIAQLKKGRLAVLENLRFHPEETIKGADAAREPATKIRKRQFARKLADLADVYVNDAFGTCHRDNASMLTVPLLMHDKPKVVGLLVRKELQYLGKALSDPPRPCIFILGGAKVSDKLGVIEALLPKCDRLLIGGAMAYTFLAAKDVAVGDSMTEPAQLENANRILNMAGDKLKLPADSVCAQHIAADVPTKVCEGPIAEGWTGLDIGPKTVSGYCDILSTAKTIVWNGPMGVFEIKPFDAGTLAIAEAAARATDAGAVSIVGGGDSAAAIFRSGLAERISHISTGGGACLEFLEGKPFETINVLDDVDAA